MTPLHDVILASASPRRVELLQSLRFQVDVRPTNFAEGDVPGLTPRELAAHHSAAKCDAALDALAPPRPAAAHNGSIDPEALAGTMRVARLFSVKSKTDLIVAADTVVDLDGKALGKPRDASESRAMIEALSGREHLVHTAVDVIVPGRAKRVQIVETTAVQFFELDEDTIARYVATGDGLDKAGAYGIQGAGAPLVEKIDGDFYTVMGFPVARFVHALASLGFVPPIFGAPLQAPVAAS